MPAPPAPARVLALSAASIAAGLVVGAATGLAVAALLREPHQDGWTELGNSLVAMALGGALGVAAAVAVAWRGVRRSFAPGRRLAGAAAVSSPLLLPVGASTGSELAGEAGALVGLLLGAALVWAAIRRG